MNQVNNYLDHKVIAEFDPENDTLLLRTKSKIKPDQTVWVSTYFAPEDFEDVLELKIIY